MKDYEVILFNLLTHMKRYGTINNEDIPELIKAIEELQVSEKLAWVQLKQLWKYRMEEL